MMPVQELSLSELFVSRYFVIPDYQREFAWASTHCRDLVQDIDALDIQRPNARRFLGYITGHPVHGDPLQTATGQDLTQINVVDGQQRLTALTLLIACLVKRLSENGEQAIADNLTSNYVITQMVPTPRLAALIATPPNTGPNVTRVLIQELPSDLRNDPQFNFSMREFFRNLVTFGDAGFPERLPSQ